MAGEPPWSEQHDGTLPRASRIGRVGRQSRLGTTCDNASGKDGARLRHDRHRDRGGRNGDRWCGRAPRSRRGTWSRAIRSTIELPEPELPPLVVRSVVYDSAGAPMAVLARRRESRRGGAGRCAARARRRGPDDRGSRLLRARRHRLARHRARARHQLRCGRGASRRIDDHPATREEHDVRRSRPALEPQGSRGRARGGARAPVHQGRDPRALPQHDLPRSWRLRRRRRRRALLRQGVGRRDVARSRAARGSDREPGGSRSHRPSWRRGPRRAATCSTACSTRARSPKPRPTSHGSCRCRARRLRCRPVPSTTRSWKRSSDASCATSDSAQRTTSVTATCSKVAYAFTRRTTPTSRRRPNSRCVRTCPLTFRTPRHSSRSRTSTGRGAGDGGRHVRRARRLQPRDSGRASDRIGVQGVHVGGRARSRVFAGRPRQRERIRASSTWARTPPSGRSRTTTAGARAT